MPWYIFLQKMFAGGRLIRTAECVKVKFMHTLSRCKNFRDQKLSDKNLLKCLFVPNFMLSDDSDDITIA